MSTFSYWATKAEIMFKGRMFNWLPAEQRRALRHRVLIKAADRYYKTFLPEEGEVPDTPVIRDDANEKIFMLWLQGEENAPPLVQACIRSARANCTQELVVLNEQTLFDYIELPGFIMDRRKNQTILPAHFSDFARVELLHNHGGFWLDTTGFVSSPIPKFITDEDFFVYLAGSINNYTFMQNCFIRARKGAYILAAWRSMMHKCWAHDPNPINYFTHQFLFRTLVQNDPKAMAHFAKMPHVDQEPTHRLWWLGQMGPKPFDRKTFEEMTSGAFFEKTSYRDWYAKDPPPGSFADEMINRMYK